MLDPKFKEKNPFKVPEGYFDNLSKEVMQSLPEKTSKAKRIPLWKKIVPAVAVAAVVAVVILSTNLFKSQQQEVDNYQAPAVGYAYNVEEMDDYYLFLEEEANEADYMDILVENY